MKKWMGIIFIYAILCIFLAGCTQAKEQEKCYYEPLEKSSLGTELFGEQATAPIADIISSNSVKIQNQSVVTKDYKVILDEYFYASNIAVLACKFRIVNTDGSNLTKTQYERLQKIGKENMDIYNEKYSSAILKDEIMLDSEGKVVWYFAELHSSIAAGDTIFNADKKERLTRLKLLWDEDGEGTFTLPDYRYNDKGITFDTSENTDILSLKATNTGVSIIWNIHDVLEEYEAMIEHLPRGEDPECYGYDVYKTITIVMKDGTEYPLAGTKENNVLKEDSEVREENDLAGYTVLWDKPVEVNDISKIVIDGKSYHAVGNNP